MQIKALTLALALCSTAAHGATVFRCIDAQGQVSFTANANCPAGHELKDVVSANNPTISRDGEYTRMAEPKSSATYVGQQRQQAIREYVARPSAGGCTTGLNDQDLRTAKVRGEVVPGMTRDDVSDMFGKATDKTARGAGGTTYWSDQYKQAFSVSYDRSGCVQSTRASGYKP